MHGLRHPAAAAEGAVDRFDEGVEAITLLLSQTVSNYSGTYVTLRDARCEPKPLQRPELKGVLAEHCAAIGRDFSEITCSCLLRGDGEHDLDRLVAAIAQWRDAGADLAVIGLPLHASRSSWPPWRRLSPPSPSPGFSWRWRD